MEWMVSSRIEFLESMKNGMPTKYFAAHLPVMATCSENQEYPVNLTAKGLGLIPKENLLANFSDIFESIIAEARTMPWKESINIRLQAIKRLYGDINNFDHSLLGGLEIFEGKALENVRTNNKVSLLYVGMNHTDSGIQYVSFQVNGRTEILHKNNPYYRFLLASRKLFEFDKFHLYQPDYPFGYLIAVDEVRDKSPWSRRPMHDKHP